MSFINELSRRNVWRAAAAYIVTAWLIIQVVETIFPAFGFGDVAIRVVVIVLATGFVPAMVVSWVFEWTPEGFRREGEVDDDAPSSMAMARRMDRIIMLVLALGLAYFAVDKFVFDPARDEALVQQTAREAAQEARSEALVESFGDKSIAVLPFANMSADPENEYFSDGISEELLNLLARIPDLRVISRSSSFNFRGKDIDIPQIAAQLSVAYILEGSVRKAGNRVRITAQLIEGRSDTHIWSEAYDRTLDDIFAIQDEISAAIVEELKPRMGLDVEEAPVATATASNAAHDAYLRGRHLFWERSIEGAVEAFEEAVQLDPDFAPALAGLALAYRFVSLYLGGDKEEWRAKAHEQAKRALELDPELAEAHAAMGYALVDPETYELAIEHFRIATELNPNYADAHVWLAQGLENLGDFPEAFKLYEKALELDPLSAVAKANVIGMRLLQGRLAEAAQENEKLRQLNPEFYAEGAILMELAEGDLAGATLAQLEAWALQGGKAYSEFPQLQVQLAAMGFPQEAIPLGGEEYLDDLAYQLLGQSSQIIEAFEAGHRGDWYHNYVLALAAAGDFERALPGLEERWVTVKHNVADPWFYVYHVLALREARIRAGGGEESADLLGALERYVSKRAEAGIVGGNIGWDARFEAGILEWLKGNREEAIALIRQAVERGYVVYPGEAYLQELYDHPGFAEIMEIQRLRQDSERAKLLSVMCKDNPYAELWSPPEESCQEFGLLQ